MENQLVNDSLLSLKDYLERLIEAMRTATDYLAKQREGDALTLIPPIIEGLEWSMQVVFLTKTTCEQIGLEVDEEKITAMFNELVDALKNEDYVLVGDLLEYEVAELLVSWQTALAKHI